MRSHRFSLALAGVLTFALAGPALAWEHKVAPSIALAAFTVLDPNTNQCAARIFFDATAGKPTYLSYAGSTTRISHQQLVAGEAPVILAAGFQTVAIGNKYGEDEIILYCH